MTGSLEARPTSPLERALDRVGDRWSLLIVEALLDGARRFGELEIALPGIAPNILTERLRRLERAGIVRSRPYQERPTRLAYELTADGRLRMVGRLKDVFRVGGENVAPAEVEEVLLGHPAVETAQVIGVPDKRLGEVPAAYVTLKSNRSSSEKELLEWCKARCANFRVPRYLRIVDNFEAIGMTASGKVQKTRLREHALREFNLS